MFIMPAFYCYNQFICAYIYTNMNIAKENLSRGIHATTGLVTGTTAGVLETAEEILETLTGVTADSIESTAAAVSDSIAQLNKVVRAKGKQITEGQISLDNARLAATTDPGNIDKQKAVETKKKELYLTKLEFANKKRELLQQTKAEVDTLSQQTKKVYKTRNETEKLVKATAASKIADANFEKAIKKAETDAKVIRSNIERDQMLAQREEECRGVLHDLKDKEDEEGELVGSEGRIPKNIAAQEKFCREKINCYKTGKRGRTFDAPWNTQKFCNILTRRYTNLKKLHQETTSSGGRRKKTLKRRLKKGKRSRKRTKSRKLKKRTRRRRRR